MNIHVLASGSTGNAVLVNFGETKLLVDAGISARRIKLGLAAAGISVEELAGVLITHEHIDHVSGIATLMKKYRVPVFARQAAWKEIHRRVVLPLELCRELGEALTVDAVEVRTFGLSHDAADPVGFCFESGGEKCSIATDLGFFTDEVRDALAFSDVLVLEANHDLAMLANGDYPWHLKRRIMSNRGHLSNVDAGWALARLPKKPHTHVFLAHMSQHNNEPALAEKTVREIIEREGFVLGRDITLHLTYPNRTASLL